MMDIGFYHRSLFNLSLYFAWEKYSDCFCVSQFRLSDLLQEIATKCYPHIQQDKDVNIERTSHHREIILNWAKSRPRNHRATDQVEQGPLLVPCCESCNFSMGLGSCFCPMTQSKEGLWVLRNHADHTPHFSTDVDMSHVSWSNNFFQTLWSWTASLAAWGGGFNGVELQHSLLHNGVLLVSKTILNLKSTIFSSYSSSC